MNVLNVFYLYDAQYEGACRAVAEVGMNDCDTVLLVFFSVTGEPDGDHRPEPSPTDREDRRRSSRRLGLTSTTGAVLASRWRTRTVAGHDWRFKNRRRPAIVAVASVPVDPPPPELAGVSREVTAACGCPSQGGRSVCG